MTIEVRNLTTRTNVVADTDTRGARPNSRLEDDASVSALRPPRASTGTLGALY